MSFHLPFGNQTDTDLLPFISEHDIPPFSRYSHQVFQPFTSSDGHDEICNPDRQINTYNDNLTCDNFDLDNEDLEKINTSAASNSRLTLASLKMIQNILKRFKCTLTC